MLSYRGGAVQPLVSAAPAPVAPWQGAQLAAKISRPEPRWPGATRGIRGPPPPKLATWSTSAEMSAAENTGSPRRACCTSRETGIRPVESWKSTEAGPTPTRDGPRWAPCPRSPWQLAQCSR
nr:hypothetical protein [Micromonospora sp. ATA51]